MQQGPAQDAPSVERPSRITDEPMSYEDMLNESNFHDIVNEDEEMYRQIDDIPDDDSNMINAVISIVQNHVSEIWSPPRVTALAHEFKLVPGFAYDIQVNDSNGVPWDFDIPEQRNQCIRDVLQQKPNFVVGSPMCTAFSILQGLNRAKMGDTKWQAMWDKGVRHMLFAIKIYRIQSESGRIFLHEHPQSASS